MKLFVGILLLGLIGCATASKLNSVSIGMSKAEVIQIMGEPNATSAQAGVEYLNYQLRNNNGPMEPFHPYFIRLVDGKVEAYGRQGDFNSSSVPTEKIIIDQKVETTSKN